MLCSNGLALTASSEVEASRESAYASAKRYILSSQLKASEDPGAVLKLEDASAGLFRFVYREGQFKDENAVLELIEMDPDRTMLKVTLPLDFGGHVQLLLQKLSDAVKQSMGGRGDPLPYDAGRVYRSALRYILKQFVVSKQKKNDVLKIAAEDVGFIKFVYEVKGFKDPNASVEVINLGKNASRINVNLRSDPGRQILLESELLAAVKSDMGEVEKKHEADAGE